MIQQLPSQSLDEQSVGSLIGFFTRNSSSSDGQDETAAGLAPNDANNSNGKKNKNLDWHLDVVARVFAEDYNSLNWTLIAQCLDTHEFYVSDLTSLSTLLKLYRAGSNQPSLPPSAIFSNWRNSMGQLSLIASLISAPPDLYTFQLNEVEAQDSLIGNPNAVPNKAWSCVNLTSHLLQLSDHPNAQIATTIRNLFRSALMALPEQIVLALVKIQQSSSQIPGPKLTSEMMGQLLNVFFKPGRSTFSAHVIRRLWDISPKIVISGCVEVRWSEASRGNFCLAGCLHELEEIVAKINVCPSKGSLSEEIETVAPAHHHSHLRGSLRSPLTAHRFLCSF